METLDSKEALVKNLVHHQELQRLAWGDEAGWREGVRVGAFFASFTCWFTLSLIDADVAFLWLCSRSCGGGGGGGDA
ncbi:hypothetical protein E2C01_094508 [Portunus trituberculatus]|uniref:Uncharacterized protein n=1 Tax=Portunus trituberculatus TaxID=210409 RepID=A0A5B7JSK8_PORTR|nr:hypothetical protein [Portunus trituberculatus]